MARRNSRVLANDARREYAITSAAYNAYNRYNAASSRRATRAANRAVLGSRSSDRFSGRSPYLSGRDLVNFSRSTGRVSYSGS